ncbi:peptidoglycan-binding domain-containing protein [Pelagibius sp. Alg239-R121]|uniref:peptidoglycan-binding domain-containing protein n=1 Tax=Pelagibius sp. Alg239-R121 TaxID=2993448 RepID=UPI0024A71416|nr:peptidoglycan-binding protein [Pelagibius sp. Alg239-R121]
MSEQSDKPAKTNKTNTTDSASDAKTGETAAKTSNREATVKAGKARETAADTRASDSSSLDIPSSKDTLSGATGRDAAKSKTAGKRQPNKKTAEKGLFETSGPEPEAAPVKSSRKTTAPNDSAAKPQAHESRAASSTSSLSTQKSTTGKQRSDEKEGAKSSKPALVGKNGKNGKKTLDAKKPNAGSPKESSTAAKSKLGTKQKVGTRMTSGGDPTIERKPALTTTTPIRKRKSDGGGSVSVLVALLFVLVAAGYYFLTQTGALNFDEDENATSVALSEDQTLDQENSGTPSETEVAETAASEPGTSQVVSDESGKPSGEAAEEPAIETAAPAPEAAPNSSTTEPTPAENKSAETTETAETEAVATAGDSTQSEVSASLPAVPTTSALAEAAQDAVPQDVAELAPQDNVAASGDTVVGTVSELADTADTKVQTTMARTETPDNIETAPDVPTELTKATLVEIEELLIRLQIDPGQPDGIIDNQATTAIRLYQEIAGLPVDGQATPELLVELREVVELLSNE